MADNPVPPIVQPNESQARTWNMLCHLSTLAGFLVPFGNIFGPLIVWQLKKQEFPSVDAHGKAALNFQLTVLIATLVSAAIGGVLFFICIGIFFFFAALGIHVAGIVFAIIAGVRANEGKEYKYPYSLELVK